VGKISFASYSTLLFYISRQQQPLKNGRNKKHCYYLRYFKLQLNDLEVLSFSCSPSKWIRKRLNRFFKASFAAFVTEICIGTSCLPSYRNDASQIVPCLISIDAAPLYYNENMFPDLLVARAFVVSMSGTSGQKGVKDTICRVRKNNRAAHATRTLLHFFYVVCQMTS